MLSQDIGDHLQAQIGVSYARRGAHHDNVNAQVLNQFLDGQLALMGGSNDGRIGPVFSYNHLMSSTYLVDAGPGTVTRSTLDTTISPLALGIRGEIRMQEGTYLTAGVHWRLDGLDYSHFNLGLRLDLDRKHVNERKDIRIFEKSEATRHITALKGGTLLVRLHTLERSIEALRERDRTIEADELEDAIRVQNIAVMNAFKQEFTFCPVYFYYSNDSEAIRSGDYAGKLMGANQRIVENIQLDSATAYIAEFGNLDQDTTALFSHYDWVSNGNFSGERKAIYAYPSSFNFSAIKVKGPDFYQLRNPFPYYVKTYGTFVFKRSPFDVVRQLNLNLWEFYEEKVQPAP